MRLVSNTFFVAAVVVAAGCTKVQTTSLGAAPPTSGNPVRPVVHHPTDPAPPNFGAGCTPPPSASIMDPTDRIPQQSDMLCWAASAQAVARAFSVPYSQCEQVQDYRGYSCPFCLTCDDSADLEPGGCNHGGLPNFDKIGLNHKTRDEAISLEQIQIEIGCRKQPVVFTWQTGIGASHMMVVYGYDGDKLYIMQPLKPCQGDTFAIDYDTYRDTDVDGGKHLVDYYDFSVK